LTLEHYRKFGGLDILIDDASERAFRGLRPNDDVPLPDTPLTKNQNEFGASTFVPALVQISEKGVVIRRIAMWETFNDEQRKFLENFIHWHLIVRKVEAKNVTVEVTSEALFRKWNRLNHWLKPERDRLEAMRSLQLDASTWDRFHRKAAFLNHRGKRLAEAESLARIERYREPLNGNGDRLSLCLSSSTEESRS
jgi:hypothetical protein